MSSAGDLIDHNWDGVDRSERAVIVAGLKEANRKDRRFGGLLARWRAENPPLDSLPLVSITRNIRNPLNPTGTETLTT